MRLPRSRCQLLVLTSIGRCARHDCDQAGVSRKPAATGWTKDRGGPLWARFRRQPSMSPFWLQACSLCPHLVLDERVALVLPGSWRAPPAARSGPTGNDHFVGHNLAPRRELATAPLPPAARREVPPTAGAPPPAEPKSAAAPPSAPLPPPPVSQPASAVAARHGRLRARASVTARGRKEATRSLAGRHQGAGAAQGDWDVGAGVLRHRSCPEGINPSACSTPPSAPAGSEVRHALVTVPKTHQVPNIERPFAIVSPISRSPFTKAPRTPKAISPSKRCRFLSREQFIA